MIERDLAFDTRRRGAVGIVTGLHRRIQDVAQSRHRDANLLELLPDLGQPENGAGNPAQQHVDRHQLAHRQRAVDHQPGTDPEHGGRQDLAHQVDSMAGDDAKLGHPEAGADIGRQLVFPAPLHLRFDGHGLEGLDAGDAFDQEGLVLGAPVELLV